MNGKVEVKQNWVQSGNVDMSKVKPHCCCSQFPVDLIKIEKAQCIGGFYHKEFWLDKSRVFYEKDSSSIKKTQTRTYALCQSCSDSGWFSVYECSPR